MKILDFFLFLWVILALLDPDPATQISADPDTDPDSKPCPCLLKVETPNAPLGPLREFPYPVFLHISILTS
jgi:hypothetical protein